MTMFLELRERLKMFYGKNSAYIVLLCKFLVALLFFININQTLGFMEPLNSVFVVLVLALVCSLLSFFATMGIGFVLVVGHCYAVGIEVALFALVLLLIMIIFYLRFAGKDSLGVILTPLAQVLEIPCAVPMSLGLLSGPTAALASVCGTIFYYFMQVVKEQATVIQGTDKSEVAKKIQLLMDGLIKNQTMWLVIVASVATVVIVYALRRMVANFAWSIAIVTGGICYLIIILGAGIFMGINVPVVSTVLQIIVSCTIMFIIKFFVFNVDYTRTESLQYEDDEYYYFVKAVPKVRIARPKRSVKTINEQEGEHLDG